MSSIPSGKLIVAAIAGGAAVALKDVANKAVSDAYQGIKTLIIDRYKRKGSIEALEKDPQSSAGQQLLAEALEKTGAVKDHEVIELAQQLSEALSQIPKEEAERYSINIERLKAANARFKRITVSGDKVLNVRDTNISFDFEIEDIEGDTNNKELKKKREVTEIPPISTSIIVQNVRVTDGNISIRIGNEIILVPRPKIKPEQFKRNPNRYFVGRKEALKNLETQLSQETRLAITAIKGMGGIGKTELALQYAIAAIKSNQYPGGICWIDVRGKDVADEILDFANIHLDFIPPDKQSSGQEIDLAKKVAACWNLWSQAFPEEKLVIFDDVAAYDQVKDFLPPYDPKLKVIITTRLRLEPLNIATLILDVLDAEDSLNLLEAYIGKD